MECKVSLGRADWGGQADVPLVPAPLCSRLSCQHPMRPISPYRSSFLKFYLKNKQKNTLFPYLGEGQAIFVLIFILYFKVIKCFALRWSLREGLDTLDVAGGEEAVVPIELPVVPVLVHLPPQYDDVPFVKLEVTGLFSLIGVEGFAIGKLRNTLGKQKMQHL